MRGSVISMLRVAVRGPAQCEDCTHWMTGRRRHRRSLHYSLNNRQTATAARHMELGPIPVGGVRDGASYQRVMAGGAEHAVDSLLDSVPTLRIIFRSVSPLWTSHTGDDTYRKHGAVREDRIQPLEYLFAAGLGAVGCNRTTTRDQRGSYTMRNLLKDESGQTMLEYVVIVVFVVIAAIIGFRLIKGIVSRSIKKASYSIEQ